jgi:hypothetical protein
VKHIRSKQFAARLTFLCSLLILCIFASARLDAQDNYEIQVYGSETVAPKTTMVELGASRIRTGRMEIRPIITPLECIFPPQV